jgi:hypothetical protein
VKRVAAHVAESFALRRHIADQDPQALPLDEAGERPDVLVQLHRRASARAPSVGGLGRPCLDLHRDQLVRQRDALASAWAWYVLPLAPGMLVFSAGMAAVPAVGPTIAACAAAATAGVFAGIAWINRRAAARLQEEIDRLPEPG